jgi:hypothetical protein
MNDFDQRILAPLYRLARPSAAPAGWCATSADHAVRFAAVSARGALDARPAAARASAAAPRRAA